MAFAAFLGEGRRGGRRWGLTGWRELPGDTEAPAQRQARAPGPPFPLQWRAGGQGEGVRGKAPVSYLYWMVSDVVDARSFVMRILTMLNRNTKLIWREGVRGGRRPGGGWR